MAHTRRISTSNGGEQAICSGQAVAAIAWLAGGASGDGRVGGGCFLFAFGLALARGPQAGALAAALGGILSGERVTLLCAYEAAGRWKAGWPAITPMRPLRTPP